MMKMKIILIPYPAQGHITPMLKLSSLFSDLGFRPVVILPEFIHRRFPPRGEGTTCLSIPDGLDGGASPEFFSIERAMEENMPVFLEELIRKMIDGDGGGVACLVVDLLASWALDVGQRCGVMVAGFWPAMHATYRVIAAIPEFIQDGVISDNGCPRNPNAPICLSPNDPPLTANDLPWLVGSSTDKIARFKFWRRTLERSRTLRSMLANTFPNEAEPKTQLESTSTINKTPQVFEIGALTMQVATTNINGSLWEEDTSCLGWLNKQNVGSVLYVSFGSWVSPIGEAKISSLALALEALERPFVWVLGPAWRGGLPERVVSHGKIVSWAPQVEVLRHPAVWCYLTHCGWNSTMEAIQCKKPLLCYPIAGDQYLNCAYIVSVWRIGVKMEGFGVEEVKDGIGKVVEDKQMIQRIEELSDGFFGKEGSSKATENLSTFIQDLGK